MNAKSNTSIDPPVSLSKLIPVIRFWSSYSFNLAKTILARATKLPGATGRLIAGPPMSERERIQHDVAEARVRALGFNTSSWFQPR